MPSARTPIRLGSKDLRKATSTSSPLRFQRRANLASRTRSAAGKVRSYLDSYAMTVRLFLVQVYGQWPHGRADDKAVVSAERLFAAAVQIAFDELRGRQRTACDSLTFLFGMASGVRRA